MATNFLLSTNGLTLGYNTLLYNLINLVNFFDTPYILMVVCIFFV